MSGYDLFNVGEKKKKRGRGKQGFPAASSTHYAHVVTSENAVGGKGGEKRRGGKRERGERLRRRFEVLLVLLGLLESVLKKEKGGGRRWGGTVCPNILAQKKGEGKESRGKGGKRKEKRDGKRGTFCFLLQGGKDCTPGENF